MSPVGIQGASAFFNAVVSQGNAFLARSGSRSAATPSLRVRRGESSVAVIELWQWRLGTDQLVGKFPRSTPTGPVPCLDATLDGASYPSLTQLTGTVLHLSGQSARPGSVTTTSSRLAVSPRTQVLYTARIVRSKTSVVAGSGQLHTDRGRVIPSCRGVPAQGRKGGLRGSVSSGDGSHIVVATYSGGFEISGVAVERPDPRWGS